MLQFFALETFKEISFDYKLRLRYAISNYGRLVSYTDEPKNGRFVKGSILDGYRVFRFKIRDADNNIKNISSIDLLQIILFQKHQTLKFMFCI